MFGSWTSYSTGSSRASVSMLPWQHKYSGLLWEAEVSPLPLAGGM